MKNWQRDILSGLTAGILFVLFYLLITKNIIICTLIGLLSFVGLQLIIGNKKEFVFVADGVTKEEVDRIILGGQDKVNSIRAELNYIKDNKVHKIVESICNTADKIFLNFRDDPKDIKASRKFLSYYLDTTALIISKYSYLLQKDISSDKIDTTIKKSEDILVVIDNTFKKQFQKLLEDDLMDLDVEIELLEKTIKMEGL